MNDRTKRAGAGAALMELVRANPDIMKRRTLWQRLRYKIGKIYRRRENDG